MEDQQIDSRQSMAFPSYTDSTSRITRHRLTWFLAFITVICMSFTIFFAYNSSLERPYSSLFVSKTPERSILILNIASQLTIFSLAELTISVLEAIRWALVCRTSGTSGLTFIGLSRATGVVGVIYLLAGKGGPSSKIWGFQRCYPHRSLINNRIALTILRFAVGILLLSDISFAPTYREIQQFPVLQAGLSEMNTTLIQTPLFST